MRRQLKLKRVGLLLLLSLLLPALIPVAVATARRGLPLVAAKPAIGDEGRQGVSRSSSETAPPGAAATAAVEGGEYATVRRRQSEAVKRKSLRFRRTSSWKMPAASSSQVNFGGRPMIPFTTDYKDVHRHPPTHN